jgi:hypothetical protein
MINFIKKLLRIENPACGKKGKEWYRSKTLWVNLISFVCIIIQDRKGFVIPLEYQALILTIVNYILRLLTDSSTGFIEDENGKKEQEKELEIPTQV